MPHGNNIYLNHPTTMMHNTALVLDEVKMQELMLTEYFRIHRKRDGYKGPLQC